MNVNVSSDIHNDATIPQLREHFNVLFKFEKAVRDEAKINFLDLMILDLLKQELLKQELNVPMSFITTSTPSENAFHNINRLVKKGYVSKRTSGIGGREIDVALTDKGKEFLEQIEPKLKASFPEKWALPSDRANIRVQFCAQHEIKMGIQRATGTNMNKLFILDAIDSDENITGTKLVSIIPVSNVSVALNPLFEEKHIEKIESEVDRRIKILALTEKSKKLLLEVKEKLQGISYDPVKMTVRRGVIIEPMQTKAQMPSLNNF